MDREELESEVWQLIDNNCFNMSQQDYLEFLMELRDNSSIRIETVEKELY